MNKESIKKFEHSALRIGEEGFTKDHFNKMVEYNDMHQSKYFTVGHKKIKFNSYVGVLQVGELVIEILPKGDRTEDTNKWGNALIQMLQIAKYIKLEVADRASLKSSKNHLIELLFRSYINEVSYLMRSGFVKKYISKSENTKALKGKLLFNKNIQYNLIHKERFFNTYTFYSQDNTNNQILKLALKTILRFSSSLSINAKTKNLLLNLDHITDLNVRSVNFNNLVIDRKTRDYKDALTLARMIILNQSSDLQQGGMPLIAFLFDMNILFEDFIYRSFKRQEKYFEAIRLKVLGQKRFKFWNNKEIRPDMIIEFEKDGLQRRIIIDTKWKLLDQLKPSDADLKQIYVYNMQLAAHHGILLYPNSGLEDTQGHYRTSKLLIDHYHSCSLSFIDPFYFNGALRKDFAYTYLYRLLNPVEIISL